MTDDSTTDRQVPSSRGPDWKWITPFERSIAERSYSNWMRRLETNGPRLGLSGPESCASGAYVTLAALSWTIGLGLLIVGLVIGAARTAGTVVVVIAGLMIILGMVRVVQGYLSDSESFKRLTSIRSLKQ